MMSTFDFHAVPSFCNAWPLIAVEINGQELWRDYVDHAQPIQVEFELLEHNQILIKYLNKNQGPELWDTVVDPQGKILQDQYCVIKHIRLGRSRCDFLLPSMVWHDANGTDLPNLHGFMSSRGHFSIDFPRDVYGWILDQRRQRLFHRPERSSALDYWTNYIGDNSHAEVNKLLQEIKQVLKEL